MGTYTQIIYHIVFSTKHRVPCLVAERRRDLLNYMWGIIRNHDCHLYRINAVEDHVHILTHLHPSVALADFIKSIKVASTGWIKKQQSFPCYRNWQDGYGAFTHSWAERHRLIEYVRNQEEHHQKLSFMDELRQLLEEAGIEYDDRWLE